MAIPAIPNKGRHVRRYPLKSGETPVEGQGVSLDTGGSNDVQAETADPSNLLGFAAHDYGSNLRFDPYDGDMLIFVARGDSTFWMSGTTDPSDETEIGNQYGLSLDANDVAQVDLTDTTNLVFVIENVDLDRNLYEVSVLEAVRQFDV